MSNLETKKEPERPSKTDVITAGAALYAAAKMKSLAESNVALVRLSHERNQLARNLNATLDEIERVSIKSQQELEEQTAQLRIANELSALKIKQDQERHQLEDLTKQEQLAIRAHLHNISREIPRLQSSYPSLVEQTLILEAFQKEIADIDHRAIFELADKRFYDEVEQLVHDSLQALAATFSEEDKNDLKLIRSPAPETIQKNCRKLMKETKDFLLLGQQIERLVTRLSSATELDDGTFKELKAELKQLEEKL